MEAGEPFIGVQCMPQSVFDEGAGHMLDFMREQGGINTLCISTHVLHGGGGRYPEKEADHGVPRVDPVNQPLARVWIPHDDANYPGTSLRMPQPSADEAEYGGVDVLDAVIAPAHERGMKVYARHLEGFHEPLWELFPQFRAVGQVDVYGEVHEAPCWHHPEYRAFWHGYVRDLLARYAVDGLYLGSERDAPFGPLFHGGSAPTCFCDHCRAKAREQGIDPDRVREGMTRLHRLMIDPAAPEAGMLASILRVWLRYPETLAWETLQSRAKWSLFGELYKFAKETRPELEIGWHLPMYPLNHDLFNRAGWDYREIGENCDFIKLSTYFDVNAARLHDQLPNLRRYYLRDFPTDADAYRFLQSVLNMDRQTEPSWEQAESSPFSPAYVRHEVRRLVEGVRGVAKAYSGIGVNIPNDDIIHKPKWVYDAARASLEAGADGLLLSREYHFMTRECLNAARDAVRDWMG